MKSVIVLIVVALIATSAVCEEPPPGWKIDIDANLTMNQSAYSDNWSGGESGSIIWAANSNSLAEKQLTTILLNRNTLKLSYGQTHTQDVESNRWKHPEKSTDLIDFESTFRFTMSKLVDPVIALRAITQFYDATDPDLREYINPATLIESAGIAKEFLKEEKRELISRIGFGLRQNINRRFDPQVEHEAGFDFVTDFTTPLAEQKLTLTTKLTVFQAVYYSESDKIIGLPEENYWKSPDVNWENIFTAGITKYLMVNLYTQLLYDKQVAKGGRFKQTLSLGITYKLM